MKCNLKEFFTYFIYLLILIFSLSLFFNLKVSTKIMEKDLKNIISHIKNEEWETSQTLFNEFNKNYKNKIEKFSIFLNHKEINDALLCMSNIIVNLEIQNKDLCLNKLSSLLFHIKNFYKSQTPNYKNIFQKPNIFYVTVNNQSYRLL